MGITTAGLKQLAQVGKGAKVEKLGGRGSGVVEFTAQASGNVTAAFRYADQGARQRIALGAWNERIRGQSLADIKGKAADLSRKLREGGDMRPATCGTLGDLLTDYVESLANPATATAVRVMFARDVPESARKLPAGAITPAHVHGWLHSMVRRGATRQVNKLRSYLSAAFARALAAGRDPRVAGSGGGLAANPVAAGTRRVGEFDRARDRVLTAAEMRERMSALHFDEAGIAVRLSILLGGQRAEQMAAAVLLDGGIVRMLDPKGRRSQPRVHDVPVPAAALPLLNGRPVGQRLFPDVTAAQMRRAFPGYGDIRRTIETRMAEMGISSDVRARIQSHGLSGVQVRHYDRADWLPQMLEALERWAAVVSGE